MGELACVPEHHHWHPMRWLVAVVVALLIYAVLLWRGVPTYTAMPSGQE